MCSLWKMSCQPTLAKSFSLNLGSSLVFIKLVSVRICYKRTHFISCLLVQCGGIRDFNHHQETIVYLLKSEINFQPNQNSFKVIQIFKMSTRHCDLVNFFCLFQIKYLVQLAFLGRVYIQHCLVNQHDLVCSKTMFSSVCVC